MWNESGQDEETAVATQAPRIRRSEAERLELIRATIEEARPGVRQDGGDLELVAVEGEIVRVRLMGACVHCSAAGHTLGGLRRKLMAALDEPVRVVPAPVD
ncbi:MAG: NifU family protein [Zoogloea sp.]|nr:NifU family protein [Zoogloea sp.]